MRKEELNHPVGLPAILNNLGPLGEALGVSPSLRAKLLSKTLQVAAVAVGTVTNWESSCPPKTAQL